MSCDSPANLAKHVRYRHVSTRSFPCQLCNHAAKSQQDLDTHMTVHTKGPNFSCHFEGCQYKCKGAYTLDRYWNLLFPENSSKKGRTNFNVFHFDCSKKKRERQKKKEREKNFSFFMAINLYFKAHRTSSHYAGAMVLLS